MIRRLQLEAWRAFDSLDVTFEEGVTFIVAENGVGKTSLVEAAAWGIYGAHSGVDARAARRKDGERAAFVSVDLELPDGAQLSITRTTAGAADAFATLDGAALPTDRIDGVLREAFGAEPEYLARVTILPTDLLRGYAEESFHLRRHLCHVYGVDALEVAGAHIRTYLTKAAGETKKLRSNLQARIRDEQALSTELSDLDEHIAQLEGDRRELREAIASAERRSAVAALIEEASAANEARANALFEIASEANRQLGMDVDAEALGHALEAEDERVISVLDGTRRQLSSMQGRLDSIGAALDDLKSADAECPVCRRPLSADDALHAEIAHANDAALISAQIDSHSAEIATLTSRQREVRAIRRRLEAVPAMREVAPSLDASAVALDDVDELHARGVELSEGLGRAKAHQSQLRDALADSTAARSEQAHATVLFRREAIATVTQSTVEAMVAELLGTRVEPVAREVTARWKRIFGQRGSLQLSPDGELSLTRGSVVVPFEDFSAGEKVVALLTARLLIVSASTRASFMWLDEPLEHLDPSNRRIVASLLATATSPVRQVLVTTYEEPLARRLAEQVPSVHLTYVRTIED